MSKASQLHLVTMQVKSSLSWMAIDADQRRRFLRYGITGGLNTLVDFIAFAVLLGIMQIAPFYANMLAFTAAVICSFFLNRNWTFNSQIASTGYQRGAALQFAVFLLCMTATALLCSWILTHLIGLGVAVVPAKLFVTIMSMLMNYILMSRVVFRLRSFGDQ